MRLVKERVKEEVTYMDERGYMVTEERWVEKEVMKEAPPTPPSRPAVRAPVAPKHSVAAALAEAAAADDDDDDAPAGKKGKAKAKAKGGAAKPAAKPKAKKDTAAQGSIKSFFGLGDTEDDDGGLSGLYKGVAGNIFKEGPSSALYLGVYEGCKTRLLASGPLAALPLVVYLISGAVGEVFG